MTSPQRKATKLLIGLAAIVAASSLWMRSYNEAPPDGPVRTLIGNYKSTESMGLLPISLLRAVRKFPTYADCVEYDDEGTMLPKWSAMENKEQLSVCTFLIADYLGDISEAQRYFNGLNLAANISNTKYDDSGIPILIISCSWLRERNTCTLPAIPRFFNAFDNSKYYSVDIYYHKDKPIHSDVVIKFL